MLSFTGSATQSHPMLASNARLRVGLWQLRGLYEDLFSFFNLSADISYLPSAVCTWLIFPTVVLPRESVFWIREIFWQQESRASLSLPPALPIAVGSGCIAASVNVCACGSAHKLNWLCGKYSSMTAASTSVCCRETLRKLGSPEGSFCCINSECYFQFDPNTPPHHLLPLVFHVVALFQPLFSNILPPVFSPNGVGSIV